MAVLTLEEYKKRKKEGTLNDNSNTNNVSTVNGNRILTLDEFKNTSQYKSIQDRINQKTSGSTKLSTKKQSGNKWRNSLDDGYDFGDITKTVLGTAGEVIPRVAKNTFEAGKEVVKNPKEGAKILGVGISSGVDKADDALNNATNDFFNWLLKKKKDNKPSLSYKEYNRLVTNGTKEEKQQVLESFKNAYGEESEQYKFYAKMFNNKDTRNKTIKTVDEIVNPKYYNTDTYKKFQNNQLSEGQQKVWNVGENIGNQLPSMAVSTVNPAVGTAMFYVQSQQNYTEEAKQRGYNDKNARIYGLIMGGVETGIERLGFDQLGGLGKLSEGSMFKAMGGEALEEFATPYVDSIIRTSFGEKVNLSDTIEESITSAVYGAVVGGIMNMGGKGIVTVDNVVNKINNKQQITSQEITQAINDIKAQDPNYFEEIMQEVPDVIKNNTNNNIDTNENIQNQVDNNTITNQNNIEQNNLTQTEIKQKIKDLTIELKSLQQLSEEGTFVGATDEAISDLKNEITSLQNQLKKKTNIPTVEDIVNQEKNNQDINLPTRDNINQQNNVYQYQTSDNEKIDNLRKSAAENNFNNSESTINYMNMLEQIITDKNVDILFDPNLKDSQGRMANGKYENGVITINPNSNRAGEFIAIHELTHAIGTDSMKNIIQKYRNSNAEFDTAVQQLLKNYDITELNEEAMADVAGQLFGNQEFINNLSRTQPSLFRKLYNEIKYLWHQFRGYKNQNEFIEDLQYKWEKAYRSNNELNNGSFESKKLNGYYPELNVNTNNISKFNIKNINNLSDVQDKIYDYYKDKYISTEQLSKPIKNIDTDMNIEIWKNGIMETFGNKDYYKNLTKEEKIMKLATMDNLAKMIKYGEIRAKDAPNKHNPNSPARYYYLEHPINIDGTNYIVNMDIRKVPNTNGRFYIHSIDTKKIGASKDLKTSRLTAPTDNNIPQINKNVKSDTSSTKYSIQESQNNTQELNNSSFSNDIKQQQLDIINKSNPADDEVHTWIRSTDDIKTFEEAFFEDGEYSGMDPDFTEDMANDSLKSGEITVYSSYPIENGTFVSPSQMEASQYAGGDASKLYSKTVNINDVAWIDGAEGQYAKVDNNTNSLVISTKDNQGRTLSKQQQNFFENSKVRDENGNLQVMYHGTPNGGFNVFNEASYFTPNEHYANNYQDENASILKQNKGTTNKQTYKVYLNIENPFELSNKTARDIYINEFIKGGNSGFFDPYTSYNEYVQQFSNNDGFDWLEAEDLKNWVKENHPEFDGLVVQEVPDNINPDAVNLAYIPFESNQIKNIDNTNPTLNDDIRFSKNNNKWDNFVESNFKTDGTGERLQDVLLPTQKDINKVNLPTNEDINLRSLEETAPSIEEKNTLGYIPQDPTRESSYDNKITDSIKETLAEPINEFKRSLDREMEDNIKSPKKIKERNNSKHQFEEMYSKFQEQFVNRNYEIDKLAKKSGNREIMYKGDMLNSVAGETSGDINVAQTDNYGKRIGPSLKELFKNSKKKGYYEQFDDYLKHYSNIDRHAYGKGSVVPLEYSQKMVKAYEQSIPGIKNEATKVWQYGKNMLNNMEENGLISKEFKGTLEELYPHYVPYMQSESMTPYMDDSGEIKPKKVIKTAKGGADNLITIEDAFERYTYAEKKAIRQNDLFKEIVKTSKEKVSFGADDRIDPTQLDGSLMKDAEGNSYVTAYVDGAQQQAKINDNLYQELTKSNELKVKETEAKYSPIVKPLQKLSEIRRNILTTWNPSFILTNSIKDIQDGMFNSKYTKDMIKNYPGAFYELATQNTETAQQFASLYGSGMVMGDYQIDSLSKASKNMDINQLNKIIKALPNANEIVELAPRYAEFKASLENGCSVTEAMYNAREVTTNFNRGGYITKALNRDGFTFLNASVQGFDKLIRNLTGQNSTKGVAVGVAGVMTKVVALGIAPAMFNAMAFGEGEDDEDESYKALPDYIKDNYYLFKIKGLGNNKTKYYDGEFLRIPKGRVLSVFGSAARRTLEYSKGDKDAFDGYLKNVESQVGINNPEENNIIAPIKQAFGSKNGEAWYGGDLVPKRLQNKPVVEQYDEGTDEFSKWLGKMINVSPYKINYLLDQYSGGAGDIILPMITKETTNGATSVGDYLIAPVKDKFIVNSTDDNKYASKFYTKLEAMQTKANSDKVSTSDKLKYKYMSSISSDMSKLYKEKREIQLDDSLSQKEKYKKIQSIQKEINKLAEEGIKEPKIKDVKSHYAKVENTEYYKNSKDSWTIIKDEEASDLKSLKMSANEKSDYFKTKNKIGTIRTSNIESSEKKDKISNLIVNMNMSDDKLAYIYGKYYSNEETLDMIQNAGISIKEFIKYNNQSFESDYYTNGKTVKNSKLAKVINYVNTLNLSAVQKAILIKMKYSSYTKYDKQIVQYLNSQNLDYLDKVTILKKIGFTAYDKQIVNKVNSMDISKEEKLKILKDMGFTIRNGRVYSK